MALGLNRNIDEDAESWLDEILREAMDDEGNILTEWEYEFASDITERYDKYGAETRISEKQWEILNRIAEKLDLTPF